LRQPAPKSSSALRWLPYLFAAGAVFWLVELTRFGAYLSAPTGREVLRQTLMESGVTTNLNAALAGESVMVFFFGFSAAALHGAAYYGLRSRKDWGWITAVIVSAGWSIVVVGIPVLVFLLRRSTREAYGIS